MNKHSGNGSLKTYRSSGTTGPDWVDGIYDDGWLQSSARLVVDRAQSIAFDLYLPPPLPGVESTPRPGEVYVGKTKVQDFSVVRGETTTVEIELDVASVQQEIELRFEGLEDAPADNRNLACLCVAMYVTRSEVVAHGHSLDSDGIVHSESHLFAVDRAVMVADVGLFIQGWSIGLGNGLRSLQLSVNGEKACEILDGALRFPRPDLVQAFDSRFAEPAETSGFAAFVALPKGTLVQAEFKIDAHYNGQSTAHLVIKPVAMPKGRAAAIELLQFPFVHRKGMRSFLSRHLGPALSQIPYTRSEDVSTDVVIYGTSPEKPRLSVIVPIYGRFDFMEMQLALFADDAEFRDLVDLIYVIDDPRLERDVRICGKLYEQLFSVPFRVVYYDKNLGYAGANNLGANIARADMLLLLNSDVFPSAPGWCSQMLERFESLPDCAALGTRLLFADGSLQHDGMNYVRAGFLEDLMICDHPGKGGPALPVGSETQSVQVPSTTGACLMVRVEDFAEVSGFDEGYLIGDFEDSDLCLALTERGGKIYVARDISLYHLERQSQSMVTGAGWKHQLTIYNCWRHHEKWEHMFSSITEWA